MEVPLTLHAESPVSQRIAHKEGGTGAPERLMTRRAVPGPPRSAGAPDLSSATERWGF